MLLLFSNMFFVILNGFTLQELCVTPLISNNNAVNNQPLINSFSKFFVCELEKSQQSQDDTNQQLQLQTDSSVDPARIVLSLSNAQNFWIIECDINTTNEASVKMLQHLVVTDTTMPLIKPQSTTMISGMCEVTDGTENIDESANKNVEKDDPQTVEVSDCFPSKYGAPIITQVKQFTDNKLLCLIATNNGHLVGIVQKC